MASSILNFIVENYLSNFIEIDPTQTSASLWSGEVQMSNVKIKKELFQSMNIPFLEVVHGYIGSIKIKMQMPIFYKSPIKVFIEKVFFHARQKNINEINKDEEIKNMEAYKLTTLQSQEILKSQINEINKEENAGMVKQIMSNLRIEITDVIFRYDDNVSYKKFQRSKKSFTESQIACQALDVEIIKGKSAILAYEWTEFLLPPSRRHVISATHNPSTGDIDIFNIYSNQVNEKKYKNIHSLFSAENFWFMVGYVLY